VPLNFIVHRNAPFSKLLSVHSRLTLPVNTSNTIVLQPEDEYPFCGENYPNGRSNAVISDKKALINIRIWQFFFLHPLRICWTITAKSTNIASVDQPPSTATSVIAAQWGVLCFIQVGSGDEPATLFLACRYN
jgi:hypothetical protein